MGNLRTDNVAQERLAEKAAELGAVRAASASGQEAARRREEERKTTLARLERGAQPTQEKEG